MRKRRNSRKSTPHPAVKGGRSSKRGGRLRNVNRSCYFTGYWVRQSQRPYFHHFCSFVNISVYHYTRLTQYTTRSTQLITSGPGDPIAKHLFQPPYILPPPHQPTATTTYLPISYVLLLTTQYQEKKPRRYGHVSLFFTLSRHDTLTAENLCLFRAFLYKDHFDSEIPQ
jgi:hypothetical protein